MCGFVGFIPRDPKTPSAIMEPIVARMMAAIRHRGPDDNGVWTQTAPAVGLGFQRLAIVDLSEAGHQPMVSASQRYVLCFNGEIYNHQTLAHRLRQTGYVFRGRSDTEILLESIERFGLQEALTHSAGMFAFALWDRIEQTLTLCRDRLGEKPLYYGLSNGNLLFASELHAIATHPEFSATLHSEALAGYLRHGYIAAPLSIYRDIAKLPPGSFLKFSIAQGLPAKLPAPTPYWTVENHWGKDPSLPSQTDEQLTDELEQRLLDTVREQCLADVPLGGFLSGGIDSSTIVALMARVSPGKVRTFTIGFHEAGFNEAEFARDVARHLKTDHTELYVTARDAMNVIPQLPRIYDEPFADSSQIPTRLLCEMARQHVTVCLSGDGGDELFNGYERYDAVARIRGLTGSLPLWTRRSMAGAIQSLVGSHPAQRGWRRKLAWASRMLGADHRTDAYRLAVSGNQNPLNFLTTEQEVPGLLHDRDWLLHTPLMRWMQAVDLRTYLPDDILVKVDRAAMSVSLETRTPFLDHRLVEFASRLPTNRLRRHGQGKWLLRQVLYRHVPRALIERPKRGFAVPVSQWLRGPLRDWAEDLLSKTALDSSGYLATSAIREVWNSHLSGQHDQGARLWSVLMFQAWQRHAHEQQAIAGRRAA